MTSTVITSGGPPSSFVPALPPGPVHHLGSIPPFVPPQQQPNFYLPPPTYPSLPPIVPPLPAPWPVPMVGPGQITGGAVGLVGSLPPSQPAMHLTTTVSRKATHTCIHTYPYTHV
jgi:hypothetical protein